MKQFIYHLDYPNNSIDVRMLSSDDVLEMYQRINSKNKFLFYSNKDIERIKQIFCEHFPEYAI